MTVIGLPEEHMYSHDQLAAICKLNDEARSALGVSSIANASVGFQTFPYIDQLAAIAAIVAYTNFDGYNDPFGERDFGMVHRLSQGQWTDKQTSDGVGIADTVCWKIDYYDNSLSAISAEPWDDSTTTRVLTIMLATEY